MKIRCCVDAWKPGDEVSVDCTAPATCEVQIGLWRGNDHYAIVGVPACAECAARLATVAEDLPDGAFRDRFWSGGFSMGGVSATFA